MVRELEALAEGNAWVAVELRGARGEEAAALGARKRELARAEREAAERMRALVCGGRKVRDGAQDMVMDATPTATTISRSDGGEIAKDEDEVVSTPGRCRIRAPAPPPASVEEGTSDEDVPVDQRREKDTCDGAIDENKYSLEDEDVDNDDDDDDDALMYTAPKDPEQTDSAVSAEEIEDEDNDLVNTLTSPTTKNVVQILMEMDLPRYHTPNSLEPSPVARAL
jgi:hypothetical protein